MLKKTILSFLLCANLSMLLAPVPAKASVDEYPYRSEAWCQAWNSITNECTSQYPDPWGFYKRECTSYVAWRLNVTNGLRFRNDSYSDASGWGYRARALGYVVDMNPAVGSVAWLEKGHVARVSAVGDKVVTIDEYNLNFSHSYSSRTVPTNSFNGYIHFKDLVGPVAPVKRVLGDYTGDNKVDFATFRPSDGAWRVNAGPGAMQWGWSGDIPAPGDYDGDGRMDTATWRPSDGRWYIRHSGGTTADLNPGPQWGWGHEDIPVPADYTGDGKTDLATWRPSDGVWRIFNGGAWVQWGWGGDVPVPADYDGDGRADLATWRPADGTWRIRYSSGRPDLNPGVQWGWGFDIPVPADYDGDGKADFATWRPSDGRWYVRFSGGAPDLNPGTQWGWGSDLPTPADYTGDGKADFATWRQSDGVWRVYGGMPWTQWGWGSDVPTVQPLNRVLLTRLGLRSS